MTLINVSPMLITYMNVKFMHILVVTGLKKSSKFYVKQLIIPRVFPDYRPALKVVALPYLLSYKMLMLPKRTLNACINF